jgi:hypothetical protein
VIRSAAARPLTGDTGGDSVAQNLFENGALLDGEILVHRTGA